MHVTYRFGSLASLADYFEKQASDYRAREHDPNPRYRKQDRILARGQASALESVAHMLRNTEITKGDA